MDHWSILCRRTGRGAGLVFIVHSYWCYRWAVLNIAAGYQKVSIHPDKMVMMAAGYLEGALTNK